MHVAIRGDTLAHQYYLKDSLSIWIKRSFRVINYIMHERQLR